MSRTTGQTPPSHSSDQYNQLDGTCLLLDITGQLTTKGLAR